MKKLIIAVILLMMLQGCLGFTIASTIIGTGWGVHQNNEIKENKDRLDEFEVQRISDQIDEDYINGRS